MDRGRHGDRLTDRLTDLLGRWTRRHGDGERRDILALNVLLLGEAQSGRSSVGNALIGGHEFPTGRGAPGVSVTTGCRRLSRSFPAFFRRKGAESDLLLRVVDTPPGKPRPQSVHELCPEGVHVIALVVRADLQQQDTHLETVTQWRRHAILILTHAGHLKEAGLRPSAFLGQSSDWLRALAEQAGGGVFFLDNGRDWPSIRGRPLREQMLRLSARNHHSAAGVRTDA